MQIIRSDYKIICNKKNVFTASSAEIRESMNRLPQWTQRGLTWLTTQPYAKQNYYLRSSIFQVGTAFLSLIIGILLSLFALYMTRYYYLIYLVGCLLTVSGMRKLQVVIYHYCAHGTVFKNKLANFILGEFISVLLVIKDLRTYRQDHMAHHNSNKLLTMEDETAQDLAEIGLLPGIPKNTLKWRLLLSFVSPFTHTRWLLNRIRNCFLSLQIMHNLIAITGWVAVFYVVNHYQVWNDFIIIWLFPLIIPYHISRILRLLVEHRWPETEVLNNRGKLFICLSTVAVLNGEALPNKTGNFSYDSYQLLSWIFKMIFIHLFVRVFVLVGDTPCHDYHHRRPSSRIWSNYIYERYQDKLQGCPGYPVNYSEVWGFWNAVDANLTALSKYKK